MKVVFASYSSKAQNTTCAIWLLGYKYLVHTFYSGRNVDPPLWFWVKTTKRAMKRTVQRKLWFFTLHGAVTLFFLFHLEITGGIDDDR